MSDHLKRIRDHMDLETRALVLQAERARLFDNSTNRGTEAEHSILRWLRARFAPDYTVSSGEIIDSFDTNAHMKSRQRDGILHVNNADANRFLLPSQMRLLPIETVAAVVEVKLTLSSVEFDKADVAAKETSRLRLRADRNKSALWLLPGETHGKTVGGAYVADPHVTEEQYAAGISLFERRFKRPSVTFALFAFGGGPSLETIRGWMEGKTIAVVCCLNVGCVVRSIRYDTDDAIVEANALESLWHFSETMGQAIDHHTRVARSLQADFSHYAPYGRNLVSLDR